MVTHVVGKACGIFCTTNQESVVQTFHQLGLTLPIDGSFDDELSVNGILPSQFHIGDWRLGGSGHILSTSLETQGATHLGEGQDDLVEFVDQE